MNITGQRVDSKGVVKGFYLDNAGRKICDVDTSRPGKWSGRSTAPEQAFQSPGCKEGAMNGFKCWMASLRRIAHAVAAEFRFNSPVLEGLASPPAAPRAEGPGRSETLRRHGLCDAGERERPTDPAVPASTRPADDSLWSRGLPLFDEARAAWQTQLGQGRSVTLSEWEQPRPPGRNSRDSRRAGLRRRPFDEGGR